MSDTRYEESMGQEENAAAVIEYINVISDRFERDARRHIKRFQ